MANPLGIAIAFNDAWNVADPAWTRIDTLSGCRVRDWTIDRGRPDEFSKTGTGTAVVHIIDTQGLFDPTNTSSPYNGKIVPSKQAAIALQNPAGAHAWFTLFRGFVEAWNYKLGPTEQWMELELQLVDGFAVLSRIELRVGVDGLLPVPAELAKDTVVYGETAGTLSDRIMAILGDAKWPVGLSTVAVDVFSGNVRVGPKGYGVGTSSLDALFDAVDAEIPGVANLYMSKDGHVTFHGRQARFRPDVAQYGIKRWTLGDPAFWTPAADPSNVVVPIAELEWSNGNDSIYNASSATPERVGTGSASRPLDPNVDNVAGQYVIDQPSIDAYGRRSITFDNLQTVLGIASGNNALAETKLFASYYVSNYKTPVPRLSRLVVKSRAPSDAHADALWGFVCQCEISSLLTVKTQHPGGGGFNTDFYVEGLHYTCRPGGIVGPPPVDIIELSLDVSPRAHYTTNPFSSDTDPS